MDSCRPMPATGTEATVERTGETLRFAGALHRDAVAALWKRALLLVVGVSRFDVSAVPSLDSAGLAMLAELAARCATPPAIIGAPDGLDALRVAYRLTPQLDFARA